MELYQGLIISLNSISNEFDRSDITIDLESVVSFEKDKGNKFATIIYFSHRSITLDVTYEKFRNTMLNFEESGKSTLKKAMELQMEFLDYIKKFKQAQN